MLRRCLVRSGKIILMYASKVSRTVGQKHSFEGVEQDHNHVCFEGVPYGGARSYSCMLRECPVRLGKNILMYALKVFHTV